MKNASLFSVDESNFNLAPPSSPPPMIVVEEEEEEGEEDVYDDYDGVVLFIDFGDDDEGGVYYNESPEDVVDDDSDDVRLIVGLKVMNIEEGSCWFWVVSVQCVWKTLVWGGMLSYYAHIFFIKTAFFHGYGWMIFVHSVAIRWLSLLDSLFVEFNFISNLS